MPQYVLGRYAQDLTTRAISKGSRGRLGTHKGIYEGAVSGVHAFEGSGCQGFKVWDVVAIQDILNRDLQCFLAVALR